MIADLTGLGRLFANEPDADDETEEDEEADEEWMGFLPPGKALGKTSEGEEGQGRGLGHRSTPHRLHEQIHRKPKKICHLFFREGGDQGDGGDSRTRDYVKKQPWGKFKGMQIFRCAIQDAAVYERLTRGDGEIAAAQVVQNVKSKIQSVIQHGHWQAWLLPGSLTPSVRATSERCDVPSSGMLQLQASRGGPLGGPPGKCEKFDYFVLYSSNDSSLQGYWYGGWKHMESRFPGGRL